MAIGAHRAPVRQQPVLFGQRRSADIARWEPLLAVLAVRAYAIEFQIASFDLLAARQAYFDRFLAGLANGAPNDKAAGIKMGFFCLITGGERDAARQRQAANPAVWIVFFTVLAYS